METAKIFANGGSQAVRLPKNCRFEEDEVYVNKIGNIVVLIPKDDPWETFLQGLDLFTEDYFHNGREELPFEERPAL